MTRSPERRIPTEVDFDHLDPAVAEDVYARLGVIRRLCPVAKSSAHGGFHLLTGYDEIREAAGHGEIFSSYVHGLGAADVVAEEAGSDGNPPPRAPLFEFDGQAHMAWRRILRPYFTPTAAKEHESLIRRLCRETLTGFAKQGRADLVTAYTQVVPPIVVAALLGVPESGRELLAEHAKRLVAAESREEAEKRGREYAKLLLGHIRERAGVPRDDMLSDVIHADLGAPASERQVLRFAALMVAAGQLTTTDAAATMALLLAENPDLRDRARDSPKVLEEFIEEAVRYEPAVAATGRAVTRPTMLGGVRLDAGDRVLLAWGSANRDERHFSDGDVFRPERGRTRPAHLGWGAGAHRCLGRHLARLELRVMLQELLAALPNLRLRADARPRRTYGVIRGVREVAVEWETAS
ncbi:cytochrome P450 [Amycolatopsis echigonensis]|uniref:Cytochrome P450 n=1 Tax=Amycolatopsis echigonensis TaxID=2576905 RepID=A0A2N3WHG1_9PSEU|nr:cytochrome P450 [Amycolatopsis niigatensis]